MPKDSTFVIEIASNVRTIEVEAPDLNTAEDEARKSLIEGEVILSTTDKSSQLHGDGDEKELN